MSSLPKSRRELIPYFEERMNATYSALSDEHELEVETSLLKTYIIESHTSEESPQSAVESILKEISQIRPDQKKKLIIEQSKDSTLFTLSTRIENEIVNLFIDTTNPRFWIINSINRSTSIDWLIDRIIKEYQNIDRAWIWPELLLKIASFGSFRGLGLDYDRRQLPDIDFESRESLGYLKMQLWGMQAGNVLETLENNFPHATTLSKIKVKYWHEKDVEDKFSIDDIKYDGKITARGTSYQSHVTLIDKLFNCYIEGIRTIEKYYTIKYELGNSNNVVINGESISIMFAKTISDVQRFSEHLFNSSFPFRLWGVPIKQSNNYYSVSGIDLHSNSRFDAEITSEYMRIYLPLGSCGNTLVRLFTNLKHYFDSKTRLVDANQHDIL